MAISSSPERTTIRRSALDSRRWIHQVYCHSHVRNGLSEPLARSSSFQCGRNAANAVASWMSWTVTAVAARRGSASAADVEVGSKKDEGAMRVSPHAKPRLKSTRRLQRFRLETVG